MITEKRNIKEFKRGRVFIFSYLFTLSRVPRLELANCKNTQLFKANE